MIINFELKVDDEFVDPDSNEVWLDDPDGVYGVKRTDTDAIVVARLTELTRLSVGVYEYEFVEPATGLQYEYYLNWLFDGVPNQLHKFIGSYNPDPDVVGRYASRQGMNMRFGLDNVNKWADVSSSGEVAQTYAIQSAITLKLVIPLISRGDIHCQAQSIERLEFPFTACYC